MAKSFHAHDTAALRDLLGIRISDALLGGGGNCALIVEGATELHAYPHFFRMAGHDARALGVSIISAEGSDTDRIKRLLTVLNVYGIPACVILDKDAARTAEDLRRYGEGGPIHCLKKVYLLERGTFETYIPLDIAVAVINERFSGETVEVKDIDPNKNREKEFQRVLHAKKEPAARFEHFKVEFGELVGRKMRETGVALPDDLKMIVDEVAALAKAP